MGKYVAISPNEVIKKKTIIPIPTYATTLHPGPALEIADPLATNKPVPILPPNAIIDKCLVFRDLLTSVSSNNFSSSLRKMQLIIINTF